MSKRTLDALSPEEREELENKCRQEIAELVLGYQKQFKINYRAIGQMLKGLRQVGLSTNHYQAAVDLEHLIPILQQIVSNLPVNNVFDLGPDAPGPEDPVGGEEEFVG